MVLQRAPHRAIVWGFGDPNTTTTLTMNDKIYTTMSRSELDNAQNESIWSVILDPVSDEGPFDIHVSQPLANGTLVTITLYDVLFGDVWICSGQSNMELTVSLIYNGTEEIANAGNYPKIRVFTAGRGLSDIPVEELHRVLLNWSIASAHSIGGPDWYYMSAVCWLYGRMIHEALGGRPIGLIATSWGGTPIEVWMPPKALQDCNIPSYVYNNIEFCFHLFSLILYRNGTIPIVSLNDSSLFNAMIHPFTRMVIYGVIWYQGKLIEYRYMIVIILIGEANVGYHTDTYACAFAKMIQYWRQIWNNRTNGITDIQYPFGFVQVSSTGNHSEFHSIFIVSNTCQQY